MDLARILFGKVICIDTAPIIYYIEGHTKYRDILHPLFIEINSGAIKAFTSTISLLEVMVLPLKKGELLLAEQYRD